MLICVNITLDTIANDTAIEGTGEKQEDMLKFLRMEFNEVCDTHWRVNSPMFHTKIQPTLMVLAFVLLPGCNHEPETMPMTAQLASELSESEMRADLEQYHDSVVEAWAYLESKRRDQSVDVTRTRDRLLARLSSKTTKQDFALLLREFAASLKEGAFRSAFLRFVRA